MSPGFSVPTPGQAPESSDGGGSGGTTVHSELTGRDAADQHPVAAISGLQDALNNATSDAFLVVEYAADLNAARPTGAAAVYWKNFPSEPTNWEDGDWWLEP